MIIYFVNKRSKVSSPFDITDASHDKIINIGDICIKDIGNALYFMVVEKNKDDWSSCRCVCKAHYEEFEVEANSLLFSFDNLGYRKGNIKILRIVANVFKGTVVYDFLYAAVEILSYRKDLWNLDFLIPIYTNNDYSEKASKVVDKNMQNVVLFYSYLSEDMKRLFNKLQEDNHTLKETYQYLRKENESEFNKAIKNFLNENPGSTIYCKI